MLYHTDDDSITTRTFSFDFLIFSSKNLPTCLTSLFILEQNRRSSLDWTNALKLQKSWNLKEGDIADRVPPFQLFEPKTRSPIKDENHPHCHIAVIASCEGEAVILSNWVRRHSSELEALIDVE